MGIYRYLLVSPFYSFYFIKVNMALCSSTPLFNPRVFFLSFFFSLHECSLSFPCVEIQFERQRQDKYIPKASLLLLLLFVPGSAAGFLVSTASSIDWETTRTANVEVYFFFFPFRRPCPFFSSQQLCIDLREQTIYLFSSTYCWVYYKDTTIGEIRPWHLYKHTPGIACIDIDIYSSFSFNPTTLQ